MAKKQALKKALQGLGLGGEYTQLIDRAIRNDWDVTEFLTALVRHPRFRRSFPGLLSGGRINDFLAEGRNTISAANLGAAIVRYKQHWEAYQDVAQAMGLTEFKINRQRMRFLIEREISPDELGRRALVLNVASKDPELLAKLNVYRKQAGMKPLTPQEMWRGLAAKQRDFYDFYEAARLGLSGLGFTPQQALSLAKNIGAPGQLADVDALAQQTMQHWAAIGPELERQGLDRAKVFSFFGNPGSDPEGIAAKIQSALLSRQAMGQPLGATYGQVGPGGGLQTVQPRETQSY